MLKPQDLLVVLRLASEDGPRPTFQTLSVELGMSSSEVHAAVKRATESNLLDAAGMVLASNLLEFLVHGVRYVFPAKPGELTRGVPTSYAAPPLAARFSVGELPPVWLTQKAP